MCTTQENEDNKVKNTYSHLLLGLSVVRCVTSVHLKKNISWIILILYLFVCIFWSGRGHCNGPVILWFFSCLCYLLVLCVILLINKLNEWIIVAGVRRMETRRYTTQLSVIISSVFSFCLTLAPISPLRTAAVLHRHCLQHGLTTEKVWCRF